MIIDLALLDQLTDGRCGRHDVACPACGPDRRSSLNRRRRVLRVWRIEPGFATFACARCGLKGHASDSNASQPDPVALDRARREATEREVIARAERLDKVKWLWAQRRPIVNTPAEVYLREPRGYGGPLPATLGFLPGRGEHPPAMIAAFGVPTEPEPGVLTIGDDAVTGVLLTRIAPDGGGKAGTDRDKIMIGHSIGTPIVLAPMNDLLGLAVAEGIEDVLSVHAATGLGAWAAGCASRLPALASAVPDYCDCVTIVADDDPDGRRHAVQLAESLRERDIEVRTVIPGAL